MANQDKSLTTTKQDIIENISHDVGSELLSPLNDGKTPLTPERMARLQYLKIIFDMLDDSRKRRIIDRLQLSEDKIVAAFQDLLG